MLRRFNKKSESMFFTVAVLLVLSTPFKLSTEERLILALACVFGSAGVHLHERFLNGSDDLEREQAMNVQERVHGVQEHVQALDAPLLVSEISQPTRSSLNVQGGVFATASDPWDDVLERRFEQTLNVQSGVQEPITLDNWMD